MIVHPISYKGVSWGPFWKRKGNEQRVPALYYRWGKKAFYKKISKEEGVFMWTDSQDENSPFTMCMGCLREKGNNQGHSIKIFLGIRNKENYYNAYMFFFFFLSVCLINLHLVKLSILRKQKLHLVIYIGTLCSGKVLWLVLSLCRGKINVCSVSWNKLLGTQQSLRQGQRMREAWKIVIQTADTTLPTEAMRPQPCSMNHRDGSVSVVHKSMNNGFHYLVSLAFVIVFLFIHFYV